MRFAVPLLILAAFAPALAADDGPPLRVRIGASDDPDPPESLRTIALSPDGRRIAVAGEPASPPNSHRLQIRNAATGRLERIIDGHEGPIRSLAFSPDGQRLASVTSDSDGVGLTRVFDPATGAATQTIDAGGQIVRFLADGRLAVVGFARVLLFDAATGREVGRFPAMPILKDITTDARLAVGVSHYGQNQLEVRDLRSGAAIAHLNGCASEPRVAVFSPDGRTVAAVDSRTKSVLVWEILTGELVHRLATSSTALSLAVTEDGRRLIAGQTDGMLRCWSIATGEQRGNLTGHTGPVMTLAVGRENLLFSGSTDRTAIGWSLASLSHSFELPVELADEEIDAAWQSLAGSDPAAAYRTLGLLAENPKVLVDALATRLERQLLPVPDADLAKLLAELDHDDYRVREAATQSLASAGESVRPHLERAYSAAASAEVRARLRLLLQWSGSSPRFSPSDVLRVRRLIAGFESAGSERATRLLRVVAEEFPDEGVQLEAKAALQRIE